MDETVFSRELAPLAGFYPSVYLGAPWWFLDAPDAMLRFRSAVTETAGFSRSSGLHRRHPRLLLHPGPPRCVPPDRGLLPGPPRGRAPRQRGPRPRNHRRPRRRLPPKGLQAVSIELHRPTAQPAAEPSPAEPAACARPPRRRCGSSTWGWAPSTARTRPGTPTRPATPRTGASPPSPAAAPTPPWHWPSRTACSPWWNAPTRGDSFAVVGSIVEAVDGADVQRLAELVAAPATAIITLTITEAAYRLGADGQPRPDRVRRRCRPCAAGVRQRKPDDAAGPAGAWPSPPAGLPGPGPLAVVCCDNLSNNGTVARNAVVGLAAGVGRRPGRLDRRQRQLRQHLGGPHHAADHGRGHRRRRGRLRLPRQFARWWPSPSPTGCSAGTSRPGGRAGRTPAPCSWTTSSRTRTANCGS